MTCSNSVQLTSTKKKRKRDDLKPENELNNLINSIDHSYPNLKKKKSKEEKSQNKTDDIPLLENQESGQKKKKRKTFQEQSEPEVQNTPTCLQYSIPEATQLPSTSSNGGNEVVTGNSNESYVAKSKPVKEQANESLLLKNGQDHEQDNPTLDNSLNETNEEDKTKKRRRRRKRKSHHKEEPALNLQVPPAPVNYVPYQPTDRKHIRFDNGQKMEIGSSEAVEKDVEVTGSTIAEKSKPPVQLFPDDEFNPLHNDKFNTKTSSPLKSKQAATLKSNGPITMDTPKVANLPIRANPNVSPFGALLSLRSAVFTRNAKPTANPVERSYNNVPPPGDLAAVEPPNCSKDQTIDEPVAQLESTASPQTVDVTKFPLFPGPPRVNDVIAFKVYIDLIV